jgi:site-specific DNA recombinase
LDAYLSGVLELPELEGKRKEPGGRSETLLAQKRRLEASANERVELAKTADSIERFCEQVKEGLSKATFEQKRALVELLIDQVVVTDEELEIRYVVPTSPGSPHPPFCHLRTDYLGGFPGREVVW